ncbi:uncharacterized protein LOC123273378 [Cotesia glomerata]|uniref:uncharacterized protein LOC123273378 n=1 Tax=Cotesia glomerata TaxID=32391 RepID=UPI001D01ECBE|nr:uncharacterized protein LOC123273378 [Cotesia glomerata]
MSKQSKKVQAKPLPTMEDINSFRNYIEACLVSAIESLTARFKYYAWKKLSQCTLISIMLFNRKRPGELERICLDDYKRAKKFEETNKDEYNQLSSQNKRLVDEYLRIEFREVGREIPLLLSTSMRSFIDIILSHRSAAQIHPDNPFIFALPGFDGTRYKHLEACVLMRKFSEKCEAVYPERLRATELRKHFATTVASLKIDECQIYDVSNFMGHAEKIYRDHYRQAVVTRDVCGVSQILEVASGVNIMIRRDQSRSTSEPTFQKQAKANDTDNDDQNAFLDNMPHHEEVNSSDSENFHDTTRVKNLTRRKRKILSFELLDRQPSDATSNSGESMKKKSKTDDLVKDKQKKVNTKKHGLIRKKKIVFDTFGNSIKALILPSGKLMRQCLKR